MRGRLVHLEPGHPWLGSYQLPGTPDDEEEAMIVAPLVAAGAPIGTLNVWREGLKPSFEREEAELIRRFATLAAMAYDNARRAEQLSQLALDRRPHRAAQPPPLPGAPLRRARPRRPRGRPGLAAPARRRRLQVGQRHARPSRRRRRSCASSPASCATACAPPTSPAAPAARSSPSILPGTDEARGRAAAPERLLERVRALAGDIRISAGVATAPTDGRTVDGALPGRRRPPAGRQGRRQGPPRRSAPPRGLIATVRRWHLPEGWQSGRMHRS